MTVIVNCDTDSDSDSNLSDDELYSSDFYDDDDEVEDNVVEEDDDYNILVNKKQLINLILNNFIYKHCMRDYNRKSNIDVDITTQGVALTIQCKCSHNLN